MELLPMYQITSVCFFNVSLILILIRILFIIYLVYGSGSGYDDKKLYEYSKTALGIDLVCPLKIRKSFQRGLSLYAFINRYWDRQSTAREEYQ